MKKSAILLLTILLIFPYLLSGKTQTYKNYTTLINSFKTVAPGYAKLKIIGKTDAGKNLYALIVGNEKNPINILSFLFSL